MRVVIQRVRSANVEIENKRVADIGIGLLILLGIEEADDDEDIEWLTRKIANMRIFPDEVGVMNRSLTDVDGAVLVVSQFTLHASTKKGNRPSYIKAARPEVATPLYESFKKTMQSLIKQEVQSGEFGADMQVSLINDGPVTILMDSKNKE